MTHLRRLAPLLLIGLLALAGCDSAGEATDDPADDPMDDPPDEEMECEAALTARVDGEPYCPFMVTARLSEQQGSEVLTLMSLTRSTNQLNIQVESPEVGTYTFAEFAGEGEARAEFFKGVRDFEAVDGALAIDVLTADRVAGTCAFTAVFNIEGEEQLAVTDGAFDVSITP